ncbi:MAG TPA: CAP domain-containing protein [Polyangiaceae bacterium]|nr:CAP domain-containing protein [Polyangiaceae bacterium]
MRRALIFVEPLRLCLGLLGQTVLVGCSPSAASTAEPSTARSHVAPSSASSGGEIFDFPEVTSSPHELSAPRDLAPFLRLCKLGDGALSRLAERLARRQSEGQSALDSSELGFALRAEGSPYVWPRTWTLEGEGLQSDATLERMRAWLDSFGDGGERRCGVALVNGGERSVLALVAVDALADLEPVPVQRRAGSWVEVNAKLLVPASDAKLLVLGPNGAPHAVPTSFDGSRARARFHADRPGAFLVQLLASVAGGPRPVLETTVYADVSPPSSFFADAAPGEPSSPLAPDADRDAALFEMVNAARHSEQSPALRRDPDLDAIAERHARAMHQLGRIAHDAGDGDPLARVEAAHLDVLITGENVAHALNVTRAHRALWASPSHRENLLDPRFDRVGIGTVLDADGSLWVCEVFADFVN